MLSIKNYVKASSLQEAYDLNQKKSARVLGGTVWMKMGNRTIQTAIDLSGLGLDQITETDSEYIIGCMTPLHLLELHEGINQMTQGAVRNSLRHIVGVQFRNCATVGGSIYGRFGFSDVLTMFLALDSYVELYGAGIIPLYDFAARKPDNDILVNVIIKKEQIRCCYQSFRNTSTDFPVLAVAAVIRENKACVSVGARPGKAVLIHDTGNITDGFAEKEIEEQEVIAHRFAEFVQSEAKVGKNMRASQEYRRHLVKVLTKRALLECGGVKNGN